MRYELHYGIREFDRNGNERPFDSSCVDYDTIDAAISAQPVFFSQMIEEMKSHHKSRSEEAFSFVLAVDDNGDDAWFLLDSATRERLNASSLSFRS